MDQFATILRDQGMVVYLVLFAYCALKSGTLPLFAGFAAQNGALDIGSVVAVVLAGGFLGDEVRFLAARRWGTSLFHRWPKLQLRLAQGVSMLERKGGLYIFLYRYPKGMRTIGAFPMGLTAMPWKNFTILNFASATVWTLVLVGGGYCFGSLVSEWVSENWGLVSTFFLVIFVGAALALLRKSAAARPEYTR